MNILIACEYSGIVRDAFLKKGHNAVSCDLLKSDSDLGEHYIGNVLDIINNGWDMLIGFPPCTYLTYAGMRNWYDDGRAIKRIKAAEFFMQLYDSKIEKVCIENPFGIMNKIFRKPDMIVHPYYFGEREMKRTCLWLKGLPKLEYSLENNLFFNKTSTDKPLPNRVELCKKTGKTKNRYFTDSIIYDEEKKMRFKTGHEKSKTFKSIANAMALQWG